MTVTIWDLRKIVGRVGFQSSLIKPGITENLYNRKLAPLNVEFVLIQGIQWYLIFENRSNGSKVVCVNKSPTLTHWWRYGSLVGDMKLGVSVPNFRKSYHTVLGAAIDSHGTRIIIINIAAGSNGGFLLNIPIITKLT